MDRTHTDRAYGSELAALRETLLHMGAKVEEMCVAPMNAVTGGSEVLAALKDLGKMFEGLQQQMGTGVRERMTQSWRELDQVKGFPVLTRDFENGKAKLAS